MLRLQVFGSIDLRDDNGRDVAAVLAQPKRLALLVYLAVAEPRGFHRRDKLLALLWPELDADQARHALRQSLHFLRRHLGINAIVTRGDEEVAVAEDALQCDAVECAARLDAGDTVGAIALYRGDFVPGFFVSDVARELDEWIDRTRARWRRRATDAITAVAQSAADGGRLVEAGRWASRGVELDPENEVALRCLMSVLARAGDRAAALRAYSDFEQRLRREYGGEPSETTRAVAVAIRAQDATHAAASVALEPVKQRTSPPPGTSRPSTPRREYPRRPAMLALLLLPLFAFGLWGWSALHHTNAPVIAIGNVEDFTHSGESTSVARVLPALLATRLGSIEGLTVVGRARWFEVAEQLRQIGGADAPAAEVARRAGASELLEGSLYPVQGGRLRMDLRRVDLATGAVRGVYTVDGADAFVLADETGALIAEKIAQTSAKETPPPTRSVAALAFYEEGLRRYYQLDNRSAVPFFRAALRADSSFAMAAYYAARCTTGDTALVDLERALAWSSRAPEHDRLLIRQAWADEANDPARLAIAETLATRYPMDPDAHLVLGGALLWSGDFLGAVPHFRRVVRLDSLGLRGHGARCVACDAYSQIVFTLELADSMTAAERVSREWLAQTPHSMQAWGAYTYVLTALNRFDEARAAFRAWTAAVPDAQPPPETYVDQALREGDLAETDRLIDARIAIGTPEQRESALWLRTISLRYQGRLREALDAAVRYRQLGEKPSWSPSQRMSHAVAEAQVLFELGRAREAAALFDSISHRTFERRIASTDARYRTWLLTQEATSLAAAGDTGALVAIADTIERLGRLSAYGRDARLHLHIRGLLAMSRGQYADAAGDFRRAIFSPTSGYTRTNLELARSLLALRRPEEAIPVLRSAIRGGIEASNYYVTRTELEELAAHAFDASGQRDSAAAYYDRVAHMWVNGDPPFVQRAATARTRADALRSPRATLAR